MLAVPQSIGCDDACMQATAKCASPQHRGRTRPAWPIKPHLVGCRGPNWANRRGAHGRRHLHAPRSRRTGGAVGGAGGSAGALACLQRTAGSGPRGLLLTPLDDAAALLTDPPRDPRDQREDDDGAVDREDDDRRSGVVASVAGRLDHKANDSQHPRVFGALRVRPEPRLGTKRRVSSGLTCWSGPVIVAVPAGLRAVGPHRPHRSFGGIRVQHVVPLAAVEHHELRLPVIGPAETMTASEDEPLRNR